LETTFKKINQITNHAYFHTGLFVVALFVLLFIGAIVYRQIGSLKASESLVSHTHTVNIELGRLLSHVKDAETSQRGFMITGDSSFLQGYMLSDQVINRSVNRLRVLTINDLEYHKELDSIYQLIDLRLSILANSLKLAGGHPVISEEVHDEMLKGQQVMNQIKEQINQQINQEIALINERENKYRSDINFAPVTYLLLILFAIGIFIYSYLKITHDQKTLKNSSNRISLINERLLTKHAELQEVENRYHLMVNEVQDYAIILLNGNGVIQNWNKGAEQIKGYHEEEIVGKFFSVFYPKADQEKYLPQRLLDEARKSGRAAHEGWRIRKNGTKFWGSVVITALHNHDNEIIGFTKVTRDLTDKKNAEEQDQQHRKSIEDKNAELQAINKELASFNHIASHDLQEPLRKIQTFISKIQEDDLERISEKGKEYFSRVRISANRMQQLISDLLTYSHVNKSDKLFESTDLNSILKVVLEELNPTLEEKKGHVETGDLPTVKVIPFQFEQLFTNIIENSLKYSKPDIHPEISISSSVVNGNDIPEAKESKYRKYHKITISDNGIGFDPKYASTIFTLFQRLHDKAEYTGTGIGLAICKKIVENHNGIISAEGHLNEGSSFHIYIPYQAA